MGRRRIGDRHIRKLFRIGRAASVGLVLPIEEVRSLGWREKQKVTVRRSGEKLIIEDWKP